MIATLSKPLTFILGLMWFATPCVVSSALAGTSVASSTVPGPVDGFSGNSDEFIWRLLVAKVGAPVSPGHPTPAEFEIWASDPDVFSKTPHFPTANEPHKFGSSLLGDTTGSDGAKAANVCHSNGLPPNTFVGGFPRSPARTACIAEEVKRNRPQYNYIVGNKLNTQEGLRTAFANLLKVEMPASAISVKADWVPISTLQQWVPQVGSQADIEKAYLTTKVDGTEFALVAMHIASKQNLRWVWGTFEHQTNPGRCDFLGCYDSFGAVDPAVQPARKGYNTQYGACTKGSRLRDMVKAGGLAPAWLNYCLKGSMVTYNTPANVPIALANSVTEGINAGSSVVAGSCMGCHSYAAFGADGRVSAGGLAMLKLNPTGEPNGDIFRATRRYDFMWGFLAAP